MLYVVLWFVISLEPGHYLHVPMDKHYETMAACEAAKPALLEMLQAEWPDDPAIRVYCEEFPPPTAL